MNTEKEERVVFGFGLALLILFIVVWRNLEPKPPFWIFMITFLGLLWLINHISRLKVFYYVVLFELLLIIRMQSQTLILSSWALAFLILSNLILVLVVVKPERLGGVFVIWMCCAGVIGHVFSGILLSILFYCVFSPVGLLLKLLKKDLLDQHLDQKAKTYWIKRVKTSFEKSSYAKQF